MTEETPEMMERREVCGKAIREVLKTHNCILTVPSIDISTGRILPTIQIKAVPRQATKPEPEPDKPEQLSSE